MQTTPEGRDLIRLSMRGGGTERSIDALAPFGWHLREIAGADEVLRLLDRQPDTAFAALLDLASGNGPLPTADMVEQLATGLASVRIGWVAAVSAEQLQLPWVRRVIRDYCHDYITLPCDSALIGQVLGHAYGMASLAPVVAAATETGMDGMVGDSPVMRTMFRSLRKAALTSAPVFIAGETGTGKELAALALHKHSSRRDMPFVTINCGAIPQGLVQSELFGFERGAFTGASRRKLGRIEMAHMGTLFLDEIGDMPMDSQSSMLRFLEQGTVERLGGHDQIRVDVRIVSATHIDLAEAVAEGRFREDLYHRLRVIELQQPPLRERGEDIERIAMHALKRYAGDAGRRIRGFSPCALRAMWRHAWPGNVRELMNCVRQAMVMADGRCITASDLRLDALASEAAQTLDEARLMGEKTAIEQALLRNGHRLVATARDLGISRVTLYRLMTRHDLRGRGDTGTATRID